MKKIIVALVLASVMATMSPTMVMAESSVENTENLFIGVSLNALDDFMSDWWGFFEAYCDEQGIKTVMTNADGSMEKQLSDIDSLIQLVPDVILINGVDSEGEIPALEACSAADIPTVEHTLGVDYEDTLHLVFDQTLQAEMQAEWVEEWAEENAVEEVYCGYLWGNQGSVNAHLRRDGFVDKCETDLGDNFTVLAEGAANWSATEAMKYCEDWMQAYPEMNCIVAANDEMAIAAANVIEAADKEGEIVVVGMDGSEQGQEYIREGKMNATIYIDRKAMAEMGADYCIKLANGEEGLVGETFDVCGGNYILLTPETIDDILGE